MTNHKNDSKTIKRVTEWDLTVKHGVDYITEINAHGKPTDLCSMTLEIEGEKAVADALLNFMNYITGRSCDFDVSVMRRNLTLELSEADIKSLRLQLSELTPETTTVFTDSDGCSLTIKMQEND